MANWGVISICRDAVKRGDDNAISRLNVPSPLPLERLAEDTNICCFAMLHLECDLYFINLSLAAFSL